jgi:hypothetical protein
MGGSVGLVLTYFLHARGKLKLSKLGFIIYAGKAFVS